MSICGEESYNIDLSVKEYAILKEVLLEVLINSYKLGAKKTVLKKIIMQISKIIIKKEIDKDTIENISNTIKEEIGRL